MKIRSLVAACLVSLSAFAIAADADVEALLGKMRDAYKGVKGARFQTQTTMFVESEKLEAEFDVTFKNPNKVRLTTDKLFGMEGQVKVISDGKTISIITPDGKEEIPFSVEAMSDGAPVNLETLCFWDYNRQLSTGEDGNMKKSELTIKKDEEWNDKKWTVLEEVAKEQEVFVKYWIDPKTNFIWRTQVFTLEKRDQVMECTVKKLDTNVVVDDSMFDGPVF